MKNKPKRPTKNAANAIDYTIRAPSGAKGDIESSRLISGIQ